MRTLDSMNTAKADDSHKPHEEVVCTTARILCQLTYFGFDKCLEEVHQGKSPRYFEVHFYTARVDERR